MPLTNTLKAVVAVGETPDPQSSRMERQEFIFSQAKGSEKELVWADLFPTPAPPGPPAGRWGRGWSSRLPGVCTCIAKVGLGVDFFQYLVTYYIGAQGDEHIVCDSVHSLFAVKRSGFATNHWVTSERT